MRIRKLVGFKTRKMIAEGLFMSKLGYLISLWGGCTAGLKKDLQIIQNRVCRVVTRRDWSTPTQELLRQCGWLSVNQLGVYHSVLLVHKTKLSGKPSYLYKMHHEEKYFRLTRQSTDEQIKLIGNPKLEISRSSFRGRSALYYNRLPKQIRDFGMLDSFKKTLKVWIQDNIDI